MISGNGFTGPGWLSIAISAGSGVTAWIAAIIRAARSARAGWVVAIVLTGVFGSLAYGLFGPAEDGGQRTSSSR